MEDILAILALLLACLGLVWGILHIPRTTAAIATTWPDWEGIQKPVGHAILLGLAVVLGLGSGWLTLSHSRHSPRPGPAHGSPNDERVALARLPKSITVGLNWLFGKGFQSIGIEGMQWLPLFEHYIVG